MERDTRALTESDIRTTTTTQLTTLGAIGRTNDERVFRYAQVGASSVGAGLLLITPAVVSNHTNINVAASSGTAAGINQIDVTIGATAATLDQYAEGYVVINNGTGKGSYYKLKGNTAATSSGTCTLYLYEPLSAAIANSSSTKVSLLANPWSGLIVQTASPLSRCAGVTNIAIPANNYGWIQVIGYCSVLADGATTKGLGVKQSPNVAGAVTVATGAADADKQIVGYAPEALVDTEYRAVWLSIN
jgi:hypothetical protein